METAKVGVMEIIGKNGVFELRFAPEVKDRALGKVLTKIAKLGGEQLLNGEEMAVLDTGIIIRRTDKIGDDI